MLALGF